MPKKKETTKVEVKQHDLFNVLQKDGKVIICMGNTQIDHHEFKTIEEATSYIDSKPYELLINAACFCMEYNKQHKK